MSPGARGRLGSKWGPLAVALGLSGVFVARSAFVVNGEVYFSLFDDAMISMRYARNLAAGHGLVWNPGQAPVEGYSNLLWTLWMAALHALGLPASKVSLLVMLSGAALLGALVLATSRLVELIVSGVADPPAAGDENTASLAGAVTPAPGVAVGFAAWMIALNHDLLFWTARGVEVALIALETTVAAGLAIQVGRRWGARRAAGLAAVMSLGVLTRDDTLPVWCCLCAYVAIAGPAEGRIRRGLWLAAPVLATLLGHMAVRWLYYAAVWPNTYYLKVAGVPLMLRWSRGLVMLARTVLLCLPVPLVLAMRAVRSEGAAAPDSSARGVSSSVAVRERGLLAAVFLIQCAYSIHAGGDAFEDELLVNRFVSASLPCLFALAALGFESMALDAPGPDSMAPKTPVGDGPAGTSGARTARVWLVAASILGFSACAVNARALLVWPGPADLRVARIAAVVIAAAAIAALLWSRHRVGSSPRATSGRRLRGAPRAGLAALLLLCAGGPALLRWARGNALWLADEQQMVRYALALGAATRPEATIAVTWAGAIPYFADRDAVDLFGKCDPVIARTPVRGTRFAPGHDRWDLDHSIGALRPDVIAQLTETPPDLLPRLGAWGYVRVGPEVFVQRGVLSPADRAAVSPALSPLPPAGSPRVDLAALRRAACTIPWDREDVWGYFDDPPALWHDRFQRECPAPAPDPH